MRCEKKKERGCYEGGVGGGRGPEHEKFELWKGGIDADSMASRAFARGSKKI